MQNDTPTVGASDSDHSDLVDVTLNDGKYTIRQVAGGGWECLRYGEPWPAFEGRQPDNLHTALAYEVDHLRRQIASLESRESAPAGLAPAPGAEATAGTDAGGTAAFDDLLSAAQEAVDFFEGTTDPELLPNEHVTIQKLRAAVGRAKGDPTVTEIFWSLFGALKEFADSSDTIADSLKKVPADHPAHGVATIRVKCGECGHISKVIEAGVDTDSGLVGCHECDSVEQLILLKVGEV